MISVILPTYNEAPNIAAMVRRVRAVLTPVDQIIVVDDRSPDGTAQAVRSLQPPDPNLLLIVRSSNPGLAPSTQRGIEAATGDIVVWLDADLSQPPEKIPQLVEQIEVAGYDIAVASRYVPGGGDARWRTGDSVLVAHVALSWTLMAITTRALQCDFHDWSSGFIAGRSHAIRSLLPLHGGYGEYFMDLICRASAAGLRLVEVPYVLTARRRGQSKTGTTYWQLLQRGTKYLRVLRRCRAIVRQPA
jgi:dolichol-phosphate mannosyltransferase